LSAEDSLGWFVDAQTINWDGVQHQYKFKHTLYQ